MEGVEVLHVDDDRQLADMTATFLSQEDGQLEVHTEQSAQAGLGHLADNHVDCIISDYDMPGQTGIEFLEAVRDEYPELPFILYTGKGSEEVASEAIAAGATDYIQKDSGSDHYELLANRVQNAVMQYQSKRELERERSQMRFALQATDAAIWTHTPDTDAMNTYPTPCPVFDAEIESPDDFISQVHPDDRSPVQRTMEAVADERSSASIDFRFSTVEGTRWGELHAQSISRDGEPGQILTGITRDITDQKEQERRFETLVRNLPGMVYRCENERDWPMQDVRGEVQSFTGYTAQELQADPTLWGEELIHPDDRERAWETVQSALERDGSFELTYRLRHRDGETRWVLEHGRGVYNAAGELEALEGFITDITGRKARERERLRNERRFKTMFNDPNILVGLLDPDGTVRDVNETALSYVDAGREAIVDTPFWETPWWPPELEGDVEQWVARAAGGEYVEYEAVHQQADGDQFAVEGVFRPVTDESGAVVSVIVSARDVTERQRRTQELERYKRIVEDLDDIVTIIDPD